MNKFLIFNIMNKIFISMGYRRIGKDTYAKQIGFGAIAAKVDENNHATFRTIFRALDGKITVFNSFESDINNDADIAYAEISCGIDEVINRGLKKTFSFFL